MKHKLYYLDTCIWLNLLKKEGDPTKGVPYNEIAKIFFEEIKYSINSKILVSPFVVKEIHFKLGKVSKIIDGFIRKKRYFILVENVPDDYKLARKIESDNYYEISFFDCLHIAISKRLNAVLVTRDKDLIKIGRKYIKVVKPENLFH